MSTILDTLLKNCTFDYQAVIDGTQGQLDPNYCPLCANLFIPNPDLSGIGYFYGYIIQCFVTSVLVVCLLRDFGNARKDGIHDKAKEETTAGKALMDSFVPKLVNGSSLVVAACLQQHEGEASNRHLRTALGLASLSGAQAAVTMAVLFRNGKGNTKWWGYLILYLIALGVMVWRIMIGLNETGRIEKWCTSSSPRNERWGEYDWAAGTVIITPLWLIVVGVGAILISGLPWFYRPSAHTRKGLRRLLLVAIWLALYGFMAGQIYWIFQLRFLYEQSKYAIQFQTTTYENENKGDISFAGSTTASQALAKIGSAIAQASVGQIITYLIGIIPAIEFFWGLWSKRKSLGDMNPEDFENELHDNPMSDPTAVIEFSNSAFKNTYTGVTVTQAPYDTQSPHDIESQHAIHSQPAAQYPNA